uniref:non-specific serine/threonine protein kinase n=1 Tax=Musa acuminata subsp. malaccensis TaxID=214687 RepID=A0A804IH66_MUSAM|nr:PREDICTED: probable serine/threonine-protein kinase NAK isoform X2 [Musa acuminata subsp. malaccensis]
MGNCFTFPARSQSTPPDTRPSSPGHWRSKASSSANTEKLSTFDSSHFGRSNSSFASADGELREGRILEVPNLRVFTFAELKTATGNFKHDKVLGEGGFGIVYKGWVDEKTLNPAKSGLGMVVAVKKLNHESVQGLEQWQSEVDFLGRLSHPNLVKLLGYCWEDVELLLVYEYMAKGSLENHLFRRGATFEPLSWSLRLKIAIDAAHGLAFLHASEKKVIYRDFKASNILLDSNYNAKLSDFGLAKHGPTDGDSHVTTRVMGTFGYAAPEYVATGHLYVKSDVYGFGVVLLEMLAGQRALDSNRPSNQHNLVAYAKPLLADRRKLGRLMDPRLEGRYPAKGALQAAQLTLKCLANDPRSRPSMKEVVETLEQIEATKGRSKAANNVSRQTVAGSRSHLSSCNHSPLHPKHEIQETDGGTSFS